MGIRICLARRQPLEFFWCVGSIFLHNTSQARPLSCHAHGGLSLRRFLVTLQIEELRGLTGFAKGHHRRTLTELLQEGEAYEAMDSMQRERHLKRVEHALGSLQW